MSDRNSNPGDARPMGWVDLNLECPACRRPLVLTGQSFACENEHRFPITAGIPRFVRSGLYAESFGFEWHQYRETQVRDITRSLLDFEAKTGITAVDLDGCLVLDAGAGAGRFAVIAANSGAQVVAIDLSAAADVALENLQGRGLVAQADILNLPFAEGSFDVVYSIGVLHHTPNTRAAVRALARQVKPGGTLAVWVYHPFRSYFFSDLYRRVTTRLSHGALYRLARAMAGLQRFHRIPIAGRILRFVVPISEELDPEWRALDTFDWYSPRFQWRHREEEVVSWFRELGFENIRTLPFPTGVRGRRPAQVAPRTT